MQVPSGMSEPRTWNERSAERRLKEAFGLLFHLYRKSATEQQHVFNIHAKIKLPA